MTLRKTLLAATVLATAGLAVPLAAQAQPVAGLYIAAGAGVNWHENVNSTVNVAGAGVFNQRIRSSLGFAGVGSVGWGFGNGLRVELEGNYRSNDVNRVGLTQAGAAVAVSQRSGYITTMGVMVNALFDFNLGPVMPYIGVGVGYGWHRWSNVGATGNGVATTRISDTDGQFAYQGIAGLAVPIAAVPGLAITAEYRYFATLNATLAGTFQPVAGAAASSSTKVENHNHSVLVGVRYNFGQAPRRIVGPGPAADPARSFLVFFDFDRADLTPRAREIIGQAAQASRTQQTTRVEVAGHADRSGTPQYNQGLSQRRANNTAAELVRLGVPRNAISVAAFGESRPLVPTADGVREPQNRRVEIVLR